MTQDGKVNILLVDDSSEKLLALGAVLDDLGQNLVRASSGREALRHLLHKEFAVILLDVNMPGMDGFETASLIRQRKSTEHIPIIFVTAYGDETHVARGYSLGAVDYIQAPIVPEVLRTKVAVFVDLARKTEQVRRQANSLRLRMVQLHKLTAASLAINSAASVERIAQVVVDTARELLGANLACVNVVMEDNWGKARSAASVAPGLEAWRDGLGRMDDLGLGAVVCRTNKPMRMSAGELAERLARPASERPLQGWLAAPLTGRDGRNLGLVEVADRSGSEFNGEDEAILVQLAQLASVAIENCLYAEEREANRMKDEFLWTLSHELRTPLNAILGWTQLLTAETLSEDVAHGIAVVARNAAAQTKLIEDLLDVSRITTGKLRLQVRPIRMQQVVAAAVDTLMPAADAKGITIERELVEEDHLMGDPDRLQQVVWNLISNAVKFTPRGGRIRVTMERSGAHVVVRVSDTGEGIKPSFLPYVFDRFRQADGSSTRPHGGLGIGLTIAKHIVELHGGLVAAESAGIGMGATFIVSLPASLPHVQTLQPEHRRSGSVEAPAPGEKVALDGLDILVVDDEADARDVLAHLLRKRNVRVRCAASVPEAVAMVRSETPDVLVADIAMPDQDGFDLIKAIRALPREQGGATPAIALTAYAREEDRRRALASGFQVHLPKPVETTHLLGAIVSLARNEEPIHASVAGTR